jgi:hypothetical protein
MCQPTFQPVKMALGQGVRRALSRVMPHIGCWIFARIGPADPRRIHRCHGRSSLLRGHQHHCDKMAIDAEALSHASPTASSRRFEKGALLGSCRTSSRFTPHSGHFTR